ncbi:MAG: thioesterase family protein [Alphaproteobacteria bacterium]|nr:thioesterase family protein [Alphaproteobacteria bacterium]
MAKLKLYNDKVIADWIDYNGHLSEAFYVLTFGFATDALYDYLGMGPNYREKTNCSVYTLESHIRYLDEVPMGSEMQFETQIISFDAKRLHFIHEMFVEGRLRATTELMGLHLDTSENGGVKLFPESVVEKLQGLVAAEIPDYVGRSVMKLKGI